MRGTYSLPEELARHAPKGRFAPGELRGACHEAGEKLGREDARKARFRAAGEMVEMWRGLDLPAWEAPYVLRETRLGYLNGYESALVSGGLSEAARLRRRGPLGRKVAGEARGRPREARVAGGEQQVVALAKREVELLGESEDRLPARRGTAILHEAQVPGEMPASRASSSWLRRRRSRHLRSSSPTGRRCCRVLVIPYSPLVPQTTASTGVVCTTRLPAWPSRGQYDEAV